MSDNIKLGIRERIREGKICLNCTRFLGYTKDKNGEMGVVESEAVIVRKIFELYLNGFLCRWCVRRNDNWIVTRHRYITKKC